MDFSSVSHPQAQTFLKTFFIHRGLNREFYQLIPEDKFDFRMVNTPQRKSDSPRESLAHQIIVERQYIQALKTGTLEFSSPDKHKFLSLSKDKLLSTLDQTDQELIELLSDNEIVTKPIKVSWSSTPLPAIDMIYSLNSHEILHTGWNLSLMDHLDIPRFPALKQVWGP